MKIALIGIIPMLSHSHSLSQSVMFKFTLHTVFNLLSLFGVCLDHD